jgi:uncharacterized protein (TIGR00645 family)
MTDSGKPNIAVRAIETILFGARWLLAPLYLAMVVLLASLVARFGLDLIHVAPTILTMDDNQVIMAVLSLIDLSLSANLVVIVILSGYENFVARIALAEGDLRPAWMGNIDFTGLKLKLLGSITAIAAIHLLRVFLEVRTEPDRVVMWQMAMLFAFVLTGLLLALTDKISGEH